MICRQASCHAASVRSVGEAAGLRCQPKDAGTVQYSTLPTTEVMYRSDLRITDSIISILHVIYGWGKCMLYMSQYAW